jgi:hypothetical protein
MPKSNPNPIPTAKGFSKRAMKDWLETGEELERFVKSRPTWCQNIFAQMEKSMSRAHGFSKPEDLTPTPAAMGALAGQFAAFSKALLRKTAAEKNASSQMKKKLKEVRKAFKALQPSLRDVAESLSKSAESFPLPKRRCSPNTRQEPLKRIVWVSIFGRLMQPGFTLLYCYLLR